MKPTGPSLWETVLRAAVIVAAVLAAWAWPHTGDEAQAASCYGSTCTGYYAPAMGCTASGGSGYLFVGGLYVEQRYASNCNSEWERTTNGSDGNRYAAGSIRYGCANYCYHQSVSSPAAIASGQVVYTPMKGPASTTPTLSCGKISTSGPISVPVTTSCIGPY